MAQSGSSEGIPILARKTFGHLLTATFTYASCRAITTDATRSPGCYLMNEGLVPRNLAMRQEEIVSRNPQAIPFLIRFSASITTSPTSHWARKTPRMKTRPRYDDTYHICRFAAQARGDKARLSLCQQHLQSEHRQLIGQS